MAGPPQSPEAGRATPWVRRCAWQGEVSAAMLTSWACYPGQQVMGGSICKCFVGGVPWQSGFFFFK